MLDLKYKSKRIGEMQPEEVSMWSKALLIKIHVITGWSIPASDEFLNILLDQFEKKLTESCGELNTDEIEYAFRTYGTAIEDWGKAMNLNLLGKVLDPYLNDRYKISEIERNVALFKSRNPFNLRTDIDYRKHIEEDYQNFRGRHLKFYIFPHHYYDVLEEDGFIPRNYYAIREKKYLTRYPDADKRKVREAARDRCVLQVFRTARKRNYQNLYLKN